MRKLNVTIVIHAFLGLVIMSGLVWAQPFHWPAVYVPTVTRGGVIRVAANVSEGGYTFNPLFTRDEWFGLLDAPPLIYRDWLGTRSFRKADGSFNFLFAKDIQELMPEQEFVVTLREGWKWSDGTEMTADDAIAARTLQGDAELEGSRFYCAEIDGEPIRYEKLSRYSYRISLPAPQVNALADNCGFLPAHIFMPVYEQAGAAGVKALWDEGTDPSQIVSGGPYVIADIRPGERVIMERNPFYGEAVRAADGSELPGSDSWRFTHIENETALLAAVVSGQLDLYQPFSVDQLRAVQGALERGNIEGTLYANLSHDTLVDFITYNFNHTDKCKRDMFQDVRFRRAISLMIDREALVDAVYGGLGFPANNYASAAAAPFDASHLNPLPFSPETGRQMLQEMGFRVPDAEGVLTNPDTGCRAAFDLQYNSGNEKRAQQAEIISQLLEPYGVSVNARQVAREIWVGSIVGRNLPRSYDSDATLWGLSSGDLDNPSFSNGLRLAANLNAWNKSKTDVDAWEILLDRLTTDMDRALDRNERVELYNERASLMQEYLPITPLISPAFHYYLNVKNVWPEKMLDAYALESNPGNFPANIMAP